MVQNNHPGQIMQNYWILDSPSISNMNSHLLLTLLERSYKVIFRVKMQPQQR